MKVSSPYAYRLPGLVPLPKGVSEVGELPPAAKKYLDGLIAAGVVKVLDAQKAAPVPKPEPAPAPAPKLEPTAAPVTVQSVRAEDDDDGAKKRSKKKD